MTMEGFSYLKEQNKIVFAIEKFISIDKISEVPDTIDKEKVIIGNAYTFYSNKKDIDGDNKQFWCMPKLTFRQKSNSFMNDEFEVDGKAVPYYIEEVITFFFGHYGEVTVSDKSIKGFKFTEKDEMKEYFNNIGSTSGFTVMIDADEMINSISATIEALKLNISYNFDDNSSEDDLIYKSVLEDDLENLNSFKELINILKSGGKIFNNEKKQEKEEQAPVIDTKQESDAKENNNVIEISIDEF